MCASFIHIEACKFSSDGVIMQQLVIYLFLEFIFYVYLFIPRKPTRIDYNSDYINRMSRE